MATKLDTFRISVVGSNSNVTNALYANNNQQCSLMVEILKVSDSSGSWQKVPLTQGEKDTVTVLPYSDQLFPPQAAGWSCDRDKNQFATGLWQRSFSAQQYEAPSALATDLEASPRNDVPERVDRFMRTDRVQNQRFMGCITVDGTRYSTHYNQGGQIYESYVEIVPQAPYILKTKDLSLYRADAYSSEYKKNNWIDVDVYYWSLPSGLKNFGESFSGAGYRSAKLEWAYARNESRLYMGMALKVGVTSLTSGDMGNIPSGGSSTVQVPLLPGGGDTMLRGVRYFCDGITTSPTYNNLLLWAVTDNYGCVSRFVLKANSDDKGNTLSLVDG